MNYIVISNFAIVLSMAVNMSAAVNTACQELSNDKTNSLISYIHKKYHIPQATTVAVEVESTSSECYRKLRFHLNGSSQSRQLIAFLPPDQRFPARDLFDTSVDPDGEDLPKNAVVQKSLLFGKYASRGSDEAKVTIVIFSDFQCPYCRQQAEVFKEIAPRYGKDLKIVFRNLRLSMHPWARPAAEMAACVFRQSNEAFWAVHDTLFSRQKEITKETLGGIVEAVVEKQPDIDRSAYQLCLAERQAEPDVEADLSFATSHKIDVTPTLFINGKEHRGVIRSDELIAMMEEQSDLVGASAKK